MIQDQRQVLGKRVPLSVLMGICQHVERDPCLRCGTRGDIGCCHGTTRKLTVRVG